MRAWTYVATGLLFGLSESGAAQICNEVIPRFGEIGYFACNLPHLLESLYGDSMPEVFKTNGFYDIGSIGYAKDILVDTNPQVSGSARAQYSSKMKASAVRGASIALPNSMYCRWSANTPGAFAFVRGCKLICTLRLTVVKVAPISRPMSLSSSTADTGDSNWEKPWAHNQQWLACFRKQ